MAKMCESLDINDFDRVAKPLVVLFQASGKAQVLLTWAIARDIERIDQATSLFREDSLSTKMITNYLRVMGTSYLNRTLGAHIRSMIAANTTYEVDPARPDWKKGNKTKLAELVEKFLQSILKSRESCPLCVPLPAALRKSVAHALQTNFDSVRGDQRGHRVEVSRLQAHSGGELHVPALHLPRHHLPFAVRPPRGYAPHLAVAALCCAERSAPQSHRRLRFCGGSYWWPR